MFSVVTGGAGFIGSHLVDRLVGQGEEVLVLDSLTAGSRANLAAAGQTGRMRLSVRDLAETGWEAEIRGAKRVWHLAADPDVRQGSITPGSQYRNNILATYHLLEAMRTTGVKELVFTSTSTVYGEASVIPTPENYAPLVPISVYGAGKLACEALISAYAHSFGIQAWVFRFANIIGPRSGHGVITDFVRKLRENPAELEILGDGRQKKSYLGVDECVGAMEYAVTHAGETVNTFNIGSRDAITVREIASIVACEIGLTGVAYRFTGGDRGWVGDVPRMMLSVDRLATIGWTPVKGSEAAVRDAVQSAIREYDSVHGGERR